MQSRACSTEPHTRCHATRAAQLLGISHCTLKRYAKRDGLLQEGIHFRRGPHNNTALLWNVQLCFETVRGAAVP